MGSLEGATAKKAMWLYPKVSGTNPRERWGHSACSFNGILYVFGGCCGGLHFSDVLALNLDTMAWNTLVTSGDGPGPRDSHCAILMGQKMILFGGTNGYKKVNSLHILDLWTKEWSRPEFFGTPPSPRESHTATLVGGDKIVIFGGSGEGEGNYLNDLHVLDLKTMRWTSPEVRGDVPVPRDSHSAVAMGNKLFVYGGDSGDRYNGDVNMLDMETLTWSKLAVQGSSPGVAAGHAAVSVGTKIFVIGGVGDNRYYNDVWTLDLNTCSWTRLNTYGQQPQGRFSHTATVMGSDIVIYGGCGEDEHPLNELMVLQLGAEYLNGHYNPTIYSTLGTHKINEKGKTLVGGVCKLPNNFTGNAVDASESSLKRKQSFQACSGIFHPKRRRTTNTKVWELEYEQEEHSLSLSQHSSPSQSDQEQNPVLNTTDHNRGSQNYLFFKQANQDSSNCHSRPTSNHRELRNIFQKTPQDRREHQQPRQEQYSHVHMGRGGLQLLRREQRNNETRSFQSLIGADVQGKIDGAFDSGFLLTASVNGKIFRGVLFSPGPAVASADSNLAQNALPSIGQSPTSMELNKSAQQHSVPEFRRSLRQPEVIRQWTAARASSSSTIEPKFKNDLQGVVLTLASPGSTNGS